VYNGGVPNRNQERPTDDEIRAHLHALFVHTLKDPAAEELAAALLEYSLKQKSHMVIRPFNARTLINHLEGKEGVPDYLEQHLQQRNHHVQLTEGTLLRLIYGHEYDQLFGPSSQYDDDEKMLFYTFRHCSKEFRKVVLSREFRFDIAKRHVLARPESEQMQIPTRLKAFAGHHQGLVTNEDFMKFTKRVMDYVPLMGERDTNLDS